MAVSMGMNVSDGYSNYEIYGNEFDSDEDQRDAYGYDDGRYEGEGETPG